LAVRFRNRIDAGKQLGAALRALLHDTSSVVVLGLPRGGVPVAREVADVLGAELDVFIVRKLGLPGEEELAMGAIASGGVRVMNEDIARYAESQHAIDEVVARETAELERRERAYRGTRPPLDVISRTVVIVDDGLATGATMRAAVRALRKMEASKIIVAVPVGAPESCASLRREADQVVCLVEPRDFRAVGIWYDDFDQTSDAEVHAALSKSLSS
jgi:putative phosphoribosyl transferase